MELLRVIEINLQHCASRSLLFGVNFAFSLSREDYRIFPYSDEYAMPFFLNRCLHKSLFFTARIETSRLIAGLLITHSILEKIHLTVVNREKNSFRGKNIKLNESWMQRAEKYLHRGNSDEIVIIHEEVSRKVCDECNCTN